MCRPREAEEERAHESNRDHHFARPGWWREAFSLCRMCHHVLPSFGTSEAGRLEPDEAERLGQRSGDGGLKQGAWPVGVEGDLPVRGEEGRDLLLGSKSCRGQGRGIRGRGWEEEAVWILGENGRVV